MLHSHLASDPIFRDAFGGYSQGNINGAAIAEEEGIRNEGLSNRGRGSREESASSPRLFNVKLDCAGGIAIAVEHRPIVHIPIAKVTCVRFHVGEAENTH